MLSALFRTAFSSTVTAYLASGSDAAMSGPAGFVPVGSAERAAAEVRPPSAGREALDMSSQALTPVSARRTPRPATETVSVRLKTFLSCVPACVPKWPGGRRCRNGAGRLRHRSPRQGVRARHHSKQLDGWVAHSPATIFTEAFSL